MPTMRETKYLLPKAALMVRDIKPPQWVNMVQDSWTEVRQKTPTEAKVAVLGKLAGDGAVRSVKRCSVFINTGENESCRSYERTGSLCCYAED